MRWMDVEVSASITYTNGIINECDIHMRHRNAGDALKGAAERVITSS